MEGNPMQGRMTPRLVGFFSEVEREFFELFCQVDGVGVERPCGRWSGRSRKWPPPSRSRTARRSRLPGIGPAMAERIVAKLRRKVPKFALMAVRDEHREAEVEPDVVSETYEVLRSLGHSESEARRLLDAALGSKKKFKDVQSRSRRFTSRAKNRSPKLEIRI